MYLIVNYMRIFSVAKRINKKITIQKADDPDKSSNDQASFLTEAYNFDLPFFWKFTYIPRYIKYFNSFEAKQLPLVQSTKYEYINSAELYKSTKLGYFLRSNCKDYLVRSTERAADKKLICSVPSNLLYHIGVFMSPIHYAI